MGNMCSTPNVDETAKAPATSTPSAPPPAQEARSLPASVPAPADSKVETPPTAVDAANTIPPTAEVEATSTIPPPDEATSPVPAEEPSKAKKLKVYVIYYSTYGHIAKLAATYKEALKTVPDVDVQLYQVAETLSKEVLEKMHAAPHADVPIIDPHTLPDADAFVFGFPTRFGMMAAQMKAFFDTTGVLWQQGALHGKPASMFTSTGTQGGGQETTIMTAVTQLAHHGMIYVPTGYAAGGIMFGVNEAKGGSPWGGGTLAGADGSRQPSEEELEAVRAQAKLFGAIAKKLAA